jgi:hypothetical protein
MRVQAAQQRVSGVTLPLEYLIEPWAHWMADQIALLVEQNGANVLGVVKVAQVLASFSLATALISFDRLAQELWLESLYSRDLPRGAHSGSGENGKHHEKRERQPERQKNPEENASHRAPFLFFGRAKANM